MDVWSSARNVYLDRLSRGTDFSDVSVLKSLTEERAQASDQQSVVYGLQSLIRPSFCKTGVREPAFGDHPDFTHLRGTNDLEHGSVVTLFVDIEGSTKLGVIYAPDVVYRIKNAIIRSAIETIQAFDGHVHRIMGDAVMAYFRSSSGCDEDSVIDALNCSSYLVEFVKEVVIPELEDDDIQHDFGIRVGLDYGATDQVLWSSYGYPGMEEVTATSFYVDAAAKLQQSAGRNNILLGQSLRDYIDLPESVWTVKTRIRGGEQESCEYLTPNYRLNNGRSINYRQYLLNQDVYWALLPVREQEPMSVHINVVSDDESKPLTSCARAVQKGSKIEFDVNLNQYIPDGAKVVYRVVNHGAEAFEKDPVKGQAHTTKSELQQRQFYQKGASNVEDTAYRGLHFMYISIEGKDGIKIIPEQKYGIYVT